MKFIDSTEIHIRAGDGGRGTVSFFRARNKPKLGADGGDGGFGGSVVLVGNPQLNTLSSLRYKRLYQAESGERGGSNGRTGRSGEDLMIAVPLGTIVIDVKTSEQLCEILNTGDKVIVAQGGHRGIGNKRFLSSTHQAPEEFTTGGKGEERFLRLDLKLLADVGLAGLPNAGKSTLLSRISAAKPKIADYPFTTLTPHLGVVDLDDGGDSWGKSFVVADIPGLIEGASEGKGLGHAFLKHLERTKIILFVLDGFSVSENETPLQTVKILQKEMKKFSEILTAKKYIAAISKIDLAPPKFNLKKLTKSLEKEGFEVLLISAVTGEGIPQLKRRLFELVSEMTTMAKSEGDDA